VTRILTFIDYYLPGYKGGGPVRALANIVDTLGHEIHFDIVTFDRDFGDEKPYEAIPIDQWVRSGASRVRYIPEGRLTVNRLLRFLRDEPYDATYLNSFFSRTSIRLLILRRLGLIPRTPIILAPRGEFAPRALALKERRKRAYLAMVRALDMVAGVTWQASSEHEAQDIRAAFASYRSLPRLVLTPELPSRAPEIGEPVLETRKVPGLLRLVFLSRISPMKNLDGVLRILAGVKAEVELSIYGPIADQNYWEICQGLIDALPSNVRAAYRGAVAFERVRPTLAQMDLFILPTHGENFGHAILEALEAGCPVLISDRTRWRGLEEDGVGWDISLDQPDRFRAVIEQVAAMDSETHDELRRRAVAYAGRVSHDPAVAERNRELFRSVAMAN
jgi:glycosyltransferase involved in cell wall biosynthesis